MLNEAPDEGTFVAWTVDDETDECLNEWLDDNGFPRLDIDFHSTIAYSRRKVLPDIAKGDIEPIEVEDFEFDFLGEEHNVLVLRFDCEEMKERHEFLKSEHGATHDFPTYKSHVTLCYDVNEIDDFDIDSYDLPDCNLVFDHEYQEPIDDKKLDKDEDDE